MALILPTGPSQTSSKLVLPGSSPKPTVKLSLNINSTDKTGIPTTALTGSLGGGFGASNLTDTSGNPLLTYENPQAMASQLLSDRTAPSFDPTKAQPIDPKTLQNQRVINSTAIRQAVGATAFNELDHIMPLELGGSNQKTNLRLEPGANPSAPYSAKNPTNTDPIENQLASQVHSGAISLVDAWKQMAQAKGITLPEQGGQVPKLNIPGIMPNVQANEQPKTPSPLQINGLNPLAPSAQDTSIGAYAMDKFPGLMSTLADLQTNPLSLGSSIKDILATPFTDAKTASDAFNATLLNFIQGIKNKASISTDVSNALQSVASFTGGVLTPITTWFNMANKVPIVGSISKLLFNVPFSVAGDVSGDTGVAALQTLSQSNGGFIPDQAVQDLTPGIKTISSLAGQIIIGGKIAPDVMGALKDQFGAKDAQTIVSKAQEVATEAKQSASQVTPDVKTETPVVKPNQEATPSTPIVESATPNEAQISTQKSEPVAPSENTKTAGIGKSIEAKAIEDKLTQGFEGTAQYESINIKEQAQKAADLINASPEDARAIIRGEKPLPEGLKGTALITAMEEHIKNTKDANLAYELANSPLVSETSKAAQEMRLAAERTPDSATGKILELRKSREAQAQKGTTKTTSDLTRAMKSEMGKVNIPKEALSWEKFLNEITC